MRHAKVCIANLLRADWKQGKQPTLRVLRTFRLLASPDPMEIPGL